MSQSLLQPTISSREPTHSSSLIKDLNNHPVSIALHSKKLGFEVCLFKDGHYRAHVLSSNQWGQPWSSATLAVFEGFALVNAPPL